MNSKESRRLATSQTLSQVAFGLIVALAAFLAFALDKRELGPLYWLLVIIGVLLLVVSMILGGRGIARISSPNGLFNLQAWFCLFGFGFLGGSFFALGAPLVSETNKLISTTSEKMGSLKTRLDTIEPLVHINKSATKQNDSAMINLTAELDELRKQVSLLEKSLKLQQSDSFDSKKAQQGAAHGLPKAAPLVPRSAPLGSQ